MLAIQISWPMFKILELTPNAEFMLAIQISWPNLWLHLLLNLLWSPLCLSAAEPFDNFDIGQAFADSSTLWNGKAAKLLGSNELHHLGSVGHRSNRGYFCTKPVSAIVALHHIVRRHPCARLARVSFQRPICKAG